MTEHTATDKTEAYGCRYIIEQLVDHAHQYEPIEGGEFDDRELALESMFELVLHGFYDLRIVDLQDGSVIATASTDD